MTDSFQNSRGMVGSLTYQLEQIDEKDKSAKDSKLKELNEAKAQTYDVAWPVEGNKIEPRKFNYEQLNDLFTSIMTAKAKLVAQRGEVDQPAKDAQDKLNEYVKEQLPGLASKDLYTLGQSIENLDIHLRQVNVNPSGASLNNLGGAGLVDRCQSCHLGTDPLLVPVTMTLTKADLGLAKSKDAPFTSHPDPDMMKYHPLEKFGCSPCHGGNGRALDTVEKAHGRYEHWLWPLYYPENYECGLPAVPRLGYGHRARSRPEPRQATLPGKGLHRLPPFPGLRQPGRTTGHRAADDHATRESEAGRPPANRATQQEGRHRHRQRNRKSLLHAGHEPDRHHVGNGRANRNARPALPQPAAGNQEGRPGPERSPDEDSQGMDSVLAEEHAYDSARPRKCRSSVCRTTKFRPSPPTSGNRPSPAPSFRSRRRETRRTEKSCSSSAAARRAIRSAKAPTWSAEISPPICPASEKRTITITWSAGS